MKVIYQLLWSIILFITPSIASIQEGYKLGAWKEENLTKIEFYLEKQDSTIFNIKVIIPLLWDGTEVGIQIYLVDKDSKKINFINFDQNARTDKQEFIGTIKLDQYQKISCSEQYLDSDQTIIRSQCKTYIEFNDKTQKKTVSEADKTVYMIVKYTFTIQYSTIGSVLFNGIPLEEKKNCPCCDINCVEDSSIGTINYNTDTNSTGNITETTSSITVARATELTNITYKFNFEAQNLRELSDTSDSQMFLSKVYVQNDNYQADLTQYIVLENNTNQLTVTSNLVNPTESIGKYFAFKFIFTNNQLDNDGKIKVKIVQTKTIVVKDLQLDYELNTKDSGTNVTKYYLIITIIGGGIMAVIIFIILIQYYRRHHSKFQELHNSFQEAKTPKSSQCTYSPYYQLPLEDQKEKNEVSPKSEKQQESRNFTQDQQQLSQVEVEQKFASIKESRLNKEK